MLRIAGVLVLLIGIYVALWIAHPNGWSESNLVDVTNRQGLLGVITLGVAVLIITGAIDLSIGSVVGFSSVAFGMMMTTGIHVAGVHTGPVHPYLAVPLVLLLGVGIGLLNGILVTRLKLQSFLVTLCGLFVFRGIARYMSGQDVGLNELKRTNPHFQDPLNVLEFYLIGKDVDRKLVYPAEMFVFLGLAVVVGVVLHKSVIGRYWYAIGYNESAARYSGIATDRHRLIGFVLSSTLASLCGVMSFLDISSASPTLTGQNLELYAITGAVLGGCSLKGGEGTIVGIVLGAMVLPVLANLLNFVGIPDAVIPIVIGMTLLFGTIADEFFRRRSAVRK
ncbi:MAG TPA: ABC transporter permease [Gemmataceae bacterium]|nr:ABC transporter permease [Gemmataceae bacterium]